MSDKKISELDAITGANTATDDFFIVVDTSGSATKKISRAELTNSLEVEFNRLNSNLNLNGNDITGTGNINVTGNVSIGTASPNKSSSSIALTVNTGTAANFSALELSSGDTLNWHINANNSNVFDVTAGTRNRIFYTNGAERMRITSGGSVGIGTTSPSAQFHSLGASGTVQTRTSVTGSTASDVAEVAVATGSRTYLVQSKGSTGDFVIRDSTGAADRVTLTSGGNVGIGTSPTYKFQVAAGTDSLVTYSASALNSNIFFDTQNTSTGASAAVVQRLITSDVAGTGSISADFQKTKAGALNINNNETNSAAYTGFGVGGSERMRIDSSGNLLVGTTDTTPWNNSANTTADNGFVVSSNGTTGITRHQAEALNLNRTGNNGSVLVFQRSGTNEGSVSVTTTGTTYNTTSDIRLKTDINPIADATDKLMAMNAVTHKWKADPDADAVHGFIAQEMQEIVPEAVSKGDNEDDMWSMDYGRITPVLVAALQDAHKKIEELAAEVAKLKAN
jgi:hypothetical protein